MSKNTSNSNQYLTLKEKHQKEANEFPFFFAFSDKQFIEGMARFGLTSDDTDKIYKFGNTGGFYLRTDAARLWEMFARHDAERKATIAADKTGNGYIYQMFRYELTNHEFTYTNDLEPTLDTLYLTMEDIEENPRIKRGLEKAIADIQRKRRKKNNKKGRASMKSKKEIMDIINHAKGSEAYHKFSTFEFYPVATDGVIELAEAAGCYWFLDIIGSYQEDERLDPHFQVWKLVVNHEIDSAVISGYNDTELIITQKIPFTDFPLDELKLYLMDGIILLPSEY